MSQPTRKHPHHSIRWHINRASRFFGSGWIYIFFKYTSSIAASCSVFVLPWLKYVDYLQTKSKPSNNSFIEWSHEHQTEGIVFLLVILSLSQIVAFILGFFQKIDRKKVQQALDSIVSRHFAKCDDDHEYRATLFKMRKFPCVGSWLGMVARSGEKYRRMQTIFSIHNSDKRQNTGLAGVCYWRGKTIFVKTPSIENIDDKGKIIDYKKKTFITDEEFNRMTVKSCVFLVTCIKIDGKKWGVLVLDSTDATVAPVDEESSGSKLDLEHTATMLSMLLK